MKRFLLSMTAVMLLAIAPTLALADAKLDYQTVCKAFDSGDHEGAMKLMVNIDKDKLSDSQVAYLDLIRAKVNLKAGSYKDALMFFGAYLKYNGKPAHSDAMKSWGRRGQAECHLAMGNYSLGLDAIDKALELEFSDRSRWVKARLQHNKKDFDGSIATLGKLLVADKRDVGKSSRWNLLGLGYLEKGDYDAAISSFESASNCKNAPAYVYNNVAASLLRRDAVEYETSEGRATTEDLEKAIRYLEKAVERGSKKAEGSLLNAREALESRTD